MEEEDNIIVKWAQEDVETSYSLLNNINNNNTSLKLLKPDGSTLLTTRFKIKKILYGARFAFSVLYGFQNKQRLLLYISLTDWFL